MHYCFYKQIKMKELMTMTLGEYLTIRTSKLKLRFYITSHGMHGEACGRGVACGDYFLLMF